MRQNNCSFSVIEARYRIGSSTVQRILKRFDASGLTLEELRTLEPGTVEELIYPPANLQRKDIPLPDFQLYYDRIHARGSKVNIVKFVRLPDLLLELQDAKAAGNFKNVLKKYTFPTLLIIDEWLLFQVSIIPQKVLWGEVRIMEHLHNLLG